MTTPYVLLGPELFRTEFSHPFHKTKVQTFNEWSFMLFFVEKYPPSFQNISIIRAVKGWETNIKIEFEDI
jgi:hypothetical protein